MTHLDRCWLIPKTPPVFLLGGRHGDIIQLSGCLHAIWKRTGIKPVMFTSKEYSSVYDGMSYVVPRVMNEGWFECVSKARPIAEREYGGGIAVQFWHDDPQHDDTIGFGGKNVITVQSHGRGFGVNTALDPDYGTSMARRMGFSRQEWLSLPPVFDRRNPMREAELIKRFDRPGRPLLLFSFSGVSSPFGYVPEVQRLLLPYRQHFNLVDLGAIRSERIFDLLGLMDRAAGLITIDSALYHLAHASPVPILLFQVDGWGASAQRLNCVLCCKYSETPKRLKEVEATVKAWM